MKRTLFYLLVFYLFPVMAFSQAKVYPEVNIPYKKFVLDNGLRLIVHEDHKAPIVAVNVWYHVGSKNEKTGKTGFAHLFEHLMFNGSENYNKDYFKLMESIGATDLNGTTNEDRTNYFQNVPVSALDQVLWLESDRMGHLVGVIDSARLNEQRGVVQNEKRQGENEPYAVTWELTTKNTYPAGHPYSWTVIGSMEDLNAASLDDVKEWFKTYYGPNNAVIVLAGDIDAQTALEKVKKYFGAIPPGPPIAKHEAWIAKMKETKSGEAQDRVPQPRLQKTWNVPQWGTKEAAYLQLLSRILTNGKSSRLYKRLVYDDQITTNVFSYLDNREISGQFYIQADAKPEVPLDKVETAVNEELKKLTTTGITPSELERAKTQHFAQFVRGAERIGGFGGKSDILAQNEVYGNDPEYYKKTNDWIKGATPEDIKRVAAEWLDAGSVYNLAVKPFPELKAATADVDRTKLPPMANAPEVKFPAAESFTLSNGLRVMLVNRSSVPVVNMRLLVNAGYSADQTSKPGVSMLAMNMLKEGTKTKNSIQISDQLADLGGSLNTYANIDQSVLALNALKSNFDKSLDVFTDVLLNPVFPQKELDRLKQEQMLNIKQEQAQPVLMGLRILPKLLYGDNHAYSTPFTGSGYEETVQAINRADLQKYYGDWFAPNNATLLVVGDMTQAELKGKLEARLASWKQKQVPQKAIADAPPPAKRKVYIMDKPGAIQSIVFAAQLAPTGSSSDWVNMDMMNRILGSEFTSRINMNLREDKHWSYGSGSYLLDTKGQSMFLGYAPVQTDKTKESVIELKKELEQYLKDKPATQEEFSKVQQNAVLQLPGGWETNAAVLGALEEQVKYNRGDDYWDKYAGRLRSMTVKDIQGAATKVIKPEQMVWIVVGDRAKIEKDIRDLNLGEVQIIEAEKPAKKAFN
ncbi:MAG TPA: pitrilysin family protein [Flavisolibacter sp.]|nr:pitrilysin family protein [Flavisolibacter sp.]